MVVFKLLSPVCRLTTVGDELVALGFEFSDDILGSDFTSGFDRVLNQFKTAFGVSLAVELALHYAAPLFRAAPRGASTWISVVSQRSLS
ncbi:hypothetical protein C480_10340 [Natrialba aegyptia DSM 13077]|uniref:Uncharacterized protein n=1 Tax=Natrialba aegyptia DSM 13077 TaxID=1227491 RepID=M0B811_9EURY|nr:hypothetical protein C480_10340 [Natrialba aegyptia DSM 13077]